MTDEIEAEVEEIPDEEVIVSFVDVKGRTVKVKRLSSIQFMQLQHEASVLESDNFSNDRKKKSLDRAFRMIHSTFVDEDDSEYVQDLIADGGLSMKELTRIVMRASRGNGEEKTAPTTVRRGRPRKR